MSAVALEHTVESADVVIMGGGICGLTLAAQLRTALPDLDIVVVERQSHPVPEAAHKVGESSVEMQAHYLRDVVGIKEHLDSEQLRKFGLRIFFTQGDNTDISRRVEFGQVEEAPLPTYQLDRGRLENHLGEHIAASGTRFLDGTRISGIEFGTDGQDHVVEITDVDGTRRLRTHWVVDASGRSGLLKRKLGLAKPVGHKANSAWLRVGQPIDVADWSNERQWQARVDVERGPYGRPGGPRRLSTNHLMGDGYWVWVIPLSSGATSIGIVADADTHPREGFNTFDRALAWLHKHEPQCAAAIEAHREDIQDFRVMRDYAYSCRQVYSSDRWCLTGEAGVSIDPLYSSGGDVMGISNGLIVDLITREHAGEDITDRVTAHNQVYLLMSEIWLVAYEKQFQVMGDAQVMVAKVIWDTMMYWSVPGLLFFHGKFPRLGDSPTALRNLLRAWKLHSRAQQFFREWHAVDHVPAQDIFADPYTLLPVIVDLHEGMAAGLSDDDLEVQFATNIGLLEYALGQLATVVIDRLEEGGDPGARAQVRAWLSDPLIKEVHASYADREDAPFDSAWVTLGARGPLLGAREAAINPRSEAS